MFYSIYESLCIEKGITPSKAADDMKINRASVTQWKNSPDIVPSGAILLKVSNYFNVSVDYLLEKTDEKNKPLVNNDEELTEYLEELKNRKEMRMLFSISKGCTKAEVEQAVRIIEALRKNGDD